MTKRLFLQLDFQQVRTKEEGTYEQLVVSEKDYPYISILRTDDMDWEEKFPEFIEHFMRGVLDEGKQDKSTDKFYKEIKEHLEYVIEKIKEENHVTMVFGYAFNWNGSGVRDFLHFSWSKRKK